mgnify:CR=1 FL=1
MNEFKFTQELDAEDLYVGLCKIDDSKKNIIKKNPHCAEYFCNLNNIFDCSKCSSYLKKNNILNFDPLYTKIDKTIVNNKLKEKQNVLVCADISYEARWGRDGKEQITLTHPHTKEEAEAFFKALDFNYDDGFGSQELFGTVWLTYGVWLSRWEYDGSEGWQVNSCPHIPNHLYKKSLED